MAFTLRNKKNGRKLTLEKREKANFKKVWRTAQAKKRKVA